MKVLIVEDDHLVRKGLTAMMPWAEHGLEIVGEAANGEEAVQFIREHEIDILITDLVMPKMSGIDLIRYIRVYFPHILSVVLTFHQDFEYVQEALRLGAIDYIAKVELQKEQSGHILERIVSRIRFERTQRAQTAKQHVISPLTHLVFGVLAVMDTYPPFQPQIPDICVTVDVDLGFRMYVVPKKDLAEELQLHRIAGERRDLILFEVAGYETSDIPSLGRALQKYRAESFFYDYKPHQCHYRISLCETSMAPSGHADSAIQKLRDRLSSLHSIVDDDLFQQAMDDIFQLRLPPPKVEGLFNFSISKWEQFTDFPTLHRLSSMHFWVEWVDWIQEARSRIQGKVRRTSHSPEVVASIMKAVDIIHRDMALDITLRDVASEVHLSPSYFSQCFRDITGTFFNDFVRHARISRAQTLLKETNQPVYWIAAQCGYPNEKYFSKVFRDHMGIIPSEYRINGK